jgi:hypothetical protein
MGERGDGAGGFPRHAIEQHPGLLIEQVQHFLLKIAVAKRHVRQVLEINDLIGRHQRRRANPDEAVPLIRV